jgi:hypothetical protein
VKEARPSDPKFLENYRQQISDRALIAQAPQQPLPIASQKDVPEVGGSPQGLNIRIDCKRFKISREALEEDWKRNRNRLLAIGILPENTPQVSIEYGRRIRLYKRFLSNKYVVTVPKYLKGNRENLRREYRRALSLVSIESLRKQRPDLFAQLSLQFDPSFRETQNMLNRFIMATNDRDKLIKAIALKFFGMMCPIARGKLKPNKIGLVEYGKRKTWEDEAVSLMTDIQQRGWYNLYCESVLETKRAEKAVRIIAEDKTQWGRRKRLALKRADTRIRLNQAKTEKLMALKDIFRFRVERK